MTEFPRVLVFTTAFQPMIGGSELALENITRRMPDFSFDIITPRYKHSFPAHESDGRVTVYRVGWGTSLDKYLFPLIGFFQTRALIQKSRYQLIHAFQASYGGIAGVIIKFVYKLPLLVTLQEGKDFKHQSLIVRFLRRWILKRADQITAISSYLAGYARGINPRARVMVIPNGVGQEFFHPPDVDRQSLRLKLKIPVEALVIASVSRLVEKNGLSDLIIALKHLIDTYPTKPWHLVVVGDGPLRKTLQDQAIRLNLAERVSFLGEISHQNLPQYLWASDVFVRPSLSEGLGSAFIEAMAADIPTIGTSVGGITDIISHGQTGLVVRPGQAKEISDAIFLLVSQPTMRHDIVISAHALVVDRYDWQAIVDQLRSVYKSMYA